MLEEGLLSLGFVVVAGALLGGLMLAERNLFAQTFAEDDKVQLRERMMAARLDADLADANELESSLTDSDDDDDDEEEDHDVSRMKELMRDDGPAVDEESGLESKKQKRRSIGEESVKAPGKITIRNIFKRRKVKEDDDEPSEASADHEALHEGQEQRYDMQNRRKGGTRRRTGSWLAKMRWGSAEEDDRSATDSPNGEFSVGPSAWRANDAGAGVSLKQSWDGTSGMEDSFYLEDDSSFPLRRMNSNTDSASTTSLLMELRDSPQPSTLPSGASLSPPQRPSSDASPTSGNRP